MRHRRVLRFLALAMALLILAGLLAQSALSTQALAPVGGRPANVALAPISAQVNAAPGDDWARVRAAGKMVVGTALDNPPFSYYDASFQPDGFDIALMAEIARRMDVQVEFVDFAFEGLLGAVQLGQVDSAIAAITIGPERQKLVDFSEPYYFGQDGILAGSDSTITAVTTAADLASRIVAVQRGSVYEKALQSTVIKTGQMPAANMLSYAKPEHVVRDVVEKRADLGVLDLPAAEAFVRQGGVKLVGQGLLPQSYGIAVEKGSTLLLPLDQALAQVQADGTAARLMEEYLGAQMPGMPTPTPTPTPVACIDGSRWEANINYPDYNMTAPPVFSPGQSFKKGWRLQNTGTCNWTPTYTLSYVSGNVPAAQMGGQPVQVGKTLAPGGMADLYANLVAPTAAGVYQGFWQMSNAEGVPFGQKVYVGIQVKVPPTPTPKPQPTATPKPGIQFSADRTTIKSGECVNFSWNVTGVQAVYFYPQGQNYQSYGVAGQGGETVCPATTTIYELRVVYPDGSVKIQQIQITVNQSANAPYIQYFTAYPPEVRVEDAVNLSWSVTGAVDRVTVLRMKELLWDYAPVVGSYVHHPDDIKLHEYVLQVWGPGGYVEARVEVNVVPRPEPK